MTVWVTAETHSCNPMPFLRRSLLPTTNFLENIANRGCGITIEDTAYANQQSRGTREIRDAKLASSFPASTHTLHT